MNSLRIHSQDRILFLAPHPDDESLAGGGLLQRAHAAGAKVRVLLATDGDNNPWPQRFLEKKIKIGSVDRARWGRRRRKEAIAAMEHLGFPKSAVRFLGLPDQGVTNLLLRKDEDVMFQFWAELTEWKPTVLIMPSMCDAHPDHSALSVMLHMVLQRIENPPRLYRFIVHPPRRARERGRVVLHLAEPEVEKKREAILMHGTQMALSRKRFAGYARDEEVFYAGPVQDHMDKHHPIASAGFGRGALKLELRLAAPSPKLGKASLIVAMESMTEGSVRWILPIPSSSQCIPIEDGATGGLVRRAAVRVIGRRAEVSLPIASLQPLKQLFIKFQQRRLFYDEAGWRQIPLPPVQELAGDPVRDGRDASDSRREESLE